MEQTWLIAGNVALIFAALTTTLVVIVYSFTRFEVSQIGRQFWLTKALLALTIDFGVVNLIIVGTPRYTSATPARFVIFALVGIIMLRWLIILIRLRRDTQRKHHPVWNAPEEPPHVRREP